jgi:hypothetical protein
VDRRAESADLADINVDHEAAPVRVRWTGPGRHGGSTDGKVDLLMNTCPIRCANECTSTRDTVPMPALAVEAFDVDQIV